MTSAIHQFPIDPVLPAIKEALRLAPRALLSAPPGAGKTTRVPPALLDDPWLRGKKILMLEPRRLAARNAAEFMSGSLGERVGTTIGYRIRGDIAVSKRTRIEVVTEGILTRMLVQDQDLPDVGAVIFDEFHERSIHADLGLALTLDLQKHLRPDLRILVMSATLDVGPLRDLLGDAEHIETAGRSFPVEIRYEGADTLLPIEHRTAAAVIRALRSHEGDVLVFLPGIKEIRRTEERLLNGGIPEGTVIHLLYGDARFEQQRAALSPASVGQRKVILSTSIAETSLTIDRITVEIEAGLARTASYVPRRDMTGLITVPVSQAIADQRTGRAGRLSAGTCYRLWPKDRHASLPSHPTPEIKATDLTHLALDLAAWGDPAGKNLAFIDPPPDTFLQRARALLGELGALHEDGRLTAHGRELAGIPVHPRYGHMILRAKASGHGALACTIAALLEERDLFSGRRNEDIDLRDRIVEIRKGRTTGGRERILEQARRLRSLAGIEEGKLEADLSGAILGLAYPDRIARRRPTGDTYQLSSGKIASLPSRSVLGKHEYLALGHVDGAGSNVRILLASPLEKRDVETIFEGQISEERDVRWDEGGGEVIARIARKAGSIVLDERPLKEESEEITAAFLEGIGQMGLHALPWDKESQAFLHRAEWVRMKLQPGDDWPVCSDEVLFSTLDTWLGPFIVGMRRRTHLGRLEMKKIISSRFSHEQRQKLDTLAPAQLKVPSGSRIRISYEGQDAPVLAVKLQELFGLTVTPTVGGGTIPVTIHLLSPAGRPLAVTQDLSSFWKNTYPDIRKQMRAKYPRHPWPEDPMVAEPTRRTVRRKKP